MSATYKSDAIGYYSQNSRKVWPSLTYIVPVNDELLAGKIALRFEISWDYKYLLYFGISTWNGEEKNNYSNCAKTKELIDYVENHLNPILDVNKTGPWYWRKFIATDIDFRNCDKGYQQLYEPDKFTKVMEGIFLEIDDAVEKIFSSANS